MNAAQTLPAELLEPSLEQNQLGEPFAAAPLNSEPTYSEVWASQQDSSESASDANQASNISRTLVFVAIGLLVLAAVMACLLLLHI